METQDIELKIGDVLKELMKENSISLQELSSTLGIPKTTLFGYLQNVMPRKASHIKRICDFFTITSDQLLFRQDIKPANSLGNVEEGKIVKGTFKIVSLD